MKKQSPKQPASETTKRPEPVGNGETAQGAPSQAANPSGEIGTAGKPDNAKRARHVFVDESDAAEMANFEPSPRLFSCACAFIWDAAKTAYSEGENNLLSRDGIADALGYIATGNAGTGAAAYSEILEEWREERAREIAALSQNEKQGGELFLKILRLNFWALFDETKKADAETMRERAHYLRSPHTGELLRTIQTYANGENADRDYFDRMTDAVIFGGMETENPNPARVRCEWLNSVFVMAGEALAQWVKVAALPDYADTLAEVKKAIADNYGIFPAPFQVCKCACGDYVELARDEISKLVFIARALNRERQAANGCEPVTVPAADRKPDADAANLTGALKDLTKTIQAANLTGAPAKQKPAGNVRGLSQAKFAALLIHYGGKCHGAPYTARAVKIWDRDTDKRPTAGGLKYTPELRRDIMGARIWAKRFNEENENAYKARKARI